MGMKKGFTLVETALVLGIAGLIFLMMFVALPALNRQARDTERREDVTKVVEELKKYQDNNRGALPMKNPAKPDGSGKWESVRYSSVDAEVDFNNDDWDTFYKEYLGGDFFDPDGTRYWLLVGYCEASQDIRCSHFGEGTYGTTGKGPGSISSPILNSTRFPNGYSISVVMGAKCSGDSSTGAVGSSNPRKFAVLYKLEGGGVYCADA